MVLTSLLSQPHFGLLKEWHCHYGNRVLFMKDNSIFHLTLPYRYRKGWLTHIIKSYPILSHRSTANFIVITNQSDHINENLTLIRECDAVEIK